MKFLEKKTSLLQESSSSPKKTLLEKPKDYAELKTALDINELITLLERSQSKQLQSNLEYLISILRSCQEENNESKSFKDRFHAALLKYKLYQNEGDSLHNLIEELSTTEPKIM